MAGYRSKTINRLFFDIETRALPDVEDYLGEVSAPRNIKDPEKVEAAIEAKRQEMIEQAPLDSDLGCIKSVSMSIRSTGAPRVVLVSDKKLGKKKQAEYENFIRLYVDEAVPEYTGRQLLDVFPEGWDLYLTDEVGLLESFWANLCLCNGASVGYNTLGFDFPFLMKRSMALHVSPGIMPSLVKYRTDPTLDLFGVLSNWAWGGGKKLKWLADRYGLEVLAPEESGASSLDMTDVELVLYSLSDLHVTRQLYSLMNCVYFSHLED